ncbi:type I restriction endonuclease subunit R [Terrisporobacter mayombei]|uniref:type I restriction endonuclease subunit R n=1 Tax=Terrisporobacter mayombei TaxID=1541 RepID=UPI0026597748|nr:DEAD/DEAH box helicase family protein [Terrisporobacter mayombei]MCC3668893.1 DEAD/DEAH box helicase family protein [Terrisporobacter mayombei]
MPINYKEITFEQDIETSLLNSGYQKGTMSTYDKEKAMDMTTLISFIQDTQPKEWARFEKQCSSDIEKKFYKAVNDAINTYGLIKVLRQGFSYRGIKFKIVYFKPESSLNENLWELYNKNILTCTRQFHYSIDNNNSLDMVLSINGIPVVALELKNQITGQDVENAKLQYMYDRDPRELCFNFNKRILVYFAVDLYDVYMTTKLEGKNTFFLPFNQGSNGAGHDGGAGNPKNENGYATSYLWEHVLQKDSLLEILQKYIHLQVDEVKVVKDNKEKKEIKKRIIFPRYHQLDVVTKLVEDVRKNGSGKNYLIQHSAGSGKSNSIAWTAYRMANLHNDNNESVFSSVIVVTDRKVLDSQLQDTISAFDHREGLVETIGDNKTSKDLRDAINDGKKIIITTLQKFPVIYEEIEDNTGKHFAIIVDEAHSSQTGNSALKLKAALADTEEALKEYAEIEGKAEDELLDGEDKLVEELLIHGRHKNLSFFAFTATPKPKTLEMFGQEYEDGTFHPFHVYSMRQAIEEGFILDVLKNYMTYRNCYRIAKNTPDNPTVSASKATKTVRKYKSLHPHNLQQKTAIMIEQFREITKNKIGGRAKAMVVTASRLHAVRYYHEFKAYIEKKGYDDVDILVAFSGVVKDGEIEYTESGINIDKDGNQIKDKQLPSKFHDDFNVLVVAEKYQTGFDEPLLHTMFVDKKLSGVKAVQTLSRLNRTCKGKNDTFILDFVNTAEEIRDAFLPYYSETSLDEELNVDLIYKTEAELRDYNLYNDADIDKFVKINFKKTKQNATDLGKMTSLLKPVVNRYMELSEDDRYKFLRTIRNFNKWYSYIIQITRMFDKDLHKTYSFTSYLQKLLPRDKVADVDLEGKLKLEFYKLEETFKGDITLNPSTEDSELVNVKNIDAGDKSEDDELLENIIKKINERFEGKFTEGDRVIVETIFNKCIKGNSKLKKQAKSNDSEIFENTIFPKVFDKIAQECYMDQMKAFSKLFEDRVFYDSVMKSIAKEAYKDLRSGSCVAEKSGAYNA